jgi:hypothetical protein
MHREIRNLEKQLKVEVYGIPRRKLRVTTKYETASLQSGPGPVEFGGENLTESPDIIIINLSFLLTKHEKDLL